MAVMRCIDEALDLDVSAAALFRVKDVVRQGEAQNVTETKSFDYFAATAALQRSVSRPIYAFHGHEMCLNGFTARRIAVVALPTLAKLHCVALWEPDTGQTLMPLPLTAMVNVASALSSILMVAHIFSLFALSLMCGHGGSTQRSSWV